MTRTSSSFTWWPRPERRTNSASGRQDRLSPVARTPPAWRKAILPLSMNPPCVVESLIAACFCFLELPLRFRLVEERPSPAGRAISSSSLERTGRGLEGGPSQRIVSRRRQILETLYCWRVVRVLIRMVDERELTINPSDITCGCERRDTKDRARVQKGVNSWGRFLNLRDWSVRFGRSGLLVVGVTHVSPQKMWGRDHPSLFSFCFFFKLKKRKKNQTG